MNDQNWIVTLIIGVAISIPISILTNLATPHIQNWLDKRALSNKGKRLKQLEQEYERIKELYDNPILLTITVARRIVSSLSFLFILAVVFMIAQLLPSMMSYFGGLVSNTLLLLAIVGTVLLSNRLQRFSVDLDRLRRFELYERIVKARISEMQKQGISALRKESETSQKQTENEPVTIFSGTTGEFSYNRSAPWNPPVACKPTHSTWRRIDGATWVWIKEHPTDQEAQSGQVVWHRFDFPLNRPSAVSKATLSLMVDDLVDIFVNGELVRNISMSEHIVDLDVKPHLQSGTNVVEMAIENSAIPNSTGKGNPTGVIYRLEIH